MNEENPYARAVAVLQGLAWVEGTPEPFPLGSAFDPQAAKSWGLCVDAVAALPDEGGPLGIASRLKTRFSGTHSSPAGEVNGRLVWRWEGCPGEPWVSAAEIAALQRMAFVWDQQTAAAAPAAAEPVAAAALSADHSPVNAKQLAAHAGCTDRMIRRYLADCPAETDRSGAKIWRYGAVLAKLRQWCEDNHQERLQAVVWPDRATNLKNKAAGTKKK